VAGGLLADQVPSAHDLYEKGREAEKAGRMSEAYLAYAQAAALEPENRTYWQRSQAVRVRALLESGRPRPGAEPPSLPEDAPIPEASYQDRSDARKPLPPTELKAEAFLRDFNLRGDSEKLFEEVTRTFGLACIFDSDYQPVGPIHFEVTGMNYREALYALQAATASFVVPINSKMLLVVKDTPQKRAEVEPTVAVAVPLPSAITAQDFNTMVIAVQQALALEKVSFDSQQNTVIIRDRISKVLPARAMLEDLLHLRGQVAVEMRMLQISRNDMIQYGVEFPDLFSLTPLTTFLNNQLTLPTNLSGLLTFGGGKTLMGLGILSPQLVATMTDSLGKVLLDSQMPSLDGQAATLHVGEHYPIASTGYFGPASFSGPNAYIPPPSFTYEDLGLSLKVTPRLHGTGEVTLDVEAEFKLLTGQTSNGIPIINNRAVKSNARMALGQWAVLAGLLSPSDAYTVSGLAGLSSIPYLGALTSTRQHTTTDDQILILFRPRLQSLSGDQFPTRTYFLGSETRPLIPL
jgi:general secretion pathway protein D